MFLQPKGTSKNRLAVSFRFYALTAASVFLLPKERLMSSPLAPVRHRHRPPSLILMLGAIATAAFIELVWPYLQSAMAGAIRAISQDILRLYGGY